MKEATDDLKLLTEYVSATAKLADKSLVWNEISDFSMDAERLQQEHRNEILQAKSFNELTKANLAMDEFVQKQKTDLKNLRETVSDKLTAAFLYAEEALNLVRKGGESSILTQEENTERPTQGTGYSIFIGQHFRFFAFLHFL